MLESLTREILKQGDRVKIVPISRLQNLRQGLEELKGSGCLNNFQNYIINDLYRLDLPDTDFEIHSIIIIATPSPALAKITFTWKEKRVPLMLPAGYIGKDTTPKRVENYLLELLSPQGYHLKYAPSLPLKRIAVMSGLAAYGRNNIGYVEGMGSFLGLAAFFSDLRCGEEDWQDIRQMDVCKECQACLTNCPTGAILGERFLIDNERCLPYFNEAGGWDFPEWIAPSAHNCIYGCLSCQTVCPMNADFLNNVIEPMEFTGEETRLLFEGKPWEQFPEQLQQKVKDLNMKEYLSALPRNLAVLFEQET